MGAVPGSAQELNITDKEGHIAFRVVVMTHAIDNYLQEARKAGLFAKRFTYDREKYRSDLETKGRLEVRLELLKVSILLFMSIILTFL